MYCNPFSIVPFLRRQTCDSTAFSSENKEPLVSLKQKMKQRVARIRNKAAHTARTVLFRLSMKRIAPKKDSRDIGRSTFYVDINGLDAGSRKESLSGAPLQEAPPEHKLFENAGVDTGANSLDKSAFYQTQINSLQWRVLKEVHKKTKAKDTLASTRTAHQAQISQLQAELLQHKQQSQQLKKALKQALKEKQAQQSKADSQVMDVKRQLAQASKELESTRMVASDNQRAHEDYAELVTLMEGDLAEERQKVQDAKTEQSALKEQHKTQVKSLENQLKATQQQLDVADVENDVQATESTLKNLLLKDKEKHLENVGQALDTIADGICKDVLLSLFSARAALQKQNGSVMEKLEEANGRADQAAANLLVDTGDQLERQLTLNDNAIKKAKALRKDLTSLMERARLKTENRFYPRQREPLTMSPEIDVPSDIEEEGPQPLISSVQY